MTLTSSCSQEVEAKVKESSDGFQKKIQVLDEKDLLVEEQDVAIVVLLKKSF